MNGARLPADGLTALQRALLALQEMEARLAAVERPDEAVAIVGMGCRFPGGAGDPEAFWRLLRDGVDAVTEVPAERWDVAALYDPDPDRSGTLYTRWGSFLAGIDRFDAPFFGISAREAVSIDPQQRLLLEVCWEALEDAGQVVDELPAAEVGVFLGLSTDDYARRHMTSGDPARIDAWAGTGAAHSVAAGRISYVLGFEGPAIAVDTACSSSLVALHLACQSLRRGETRVALAGGVGLILSPENTLFLCRARTLSPGGRCRTFDAAADGYVRGEGCGVVVLKRLADAVADGDPVLAVVRGSAVNHDGRSGGLTVPNGGAQQAVLRRALADAGTGPAELDYVEAHGTGTALGDPVELNALAAVFGPGRPAGRPLLVGSVKTNIGHTEAAAGMAGLIKVVQALRHEEIPPHLHLRQPTPHVPWPEMPLAVPTARTGWPRGERRRLAGISSFGISGTNAHVVVEEAPQPEEPPEPAGGDERLLPLSARSPAALAELARAYRDLLAGGGPGLRDICHTAGARRSHHAHRLAVAGASRAEIAARLDGWLKHGAAPGVHAGRAVPGRRPGVVFVFPGQGPQWPGMGLDLLAREPAFRAAFERCAAALEPELGTPLAGLLAGGPGFERVERLQPALFAFQVALAALWRAWGIQPDAVVGHSMGEVAAACVAGALDLTDGARIICRRSRLLSRLSGRGAMAVVELPLAAARQAVAGHGGRLAVAAANSRRATVLSGEAGALAEVLGRLAADGVFCRPVQVDVASHCAEVDELRGDLLAALAGLAPGPAEVPLCSTVTGDLVDGRELGPDYWVRNLREPVLFAPAVERLARGGHELFVEISPHPALRNAIEDDLAALGRGAALSSSRRGEGGRGPLLETLAALYAAGCAVDWRGLDADGGRCVPLPPYPWQRERFWLEPPAPAAGSGGGHLLLGRRLRSAARPGTWIWETALGAGSAPWLAEHRVAGAALLPAAAYLEMALAAAREASGADPGGLEEVRFREALALPEEGCRTVQVTLAAGAAGRASFQVHSLPAGAAGETPWILHAEGTVCLDPSPAEGAPAVARERLRAAGAAGEVASEGLYRALRRQGFEYGPSFQGVDRLVRDGGEALGRLGWPEAVAREAGGFRLHPALLDAAFQVLAAAGAEPDEDAGEDLCLPARLRALRLWRLPRAGEELWSRVRPAGGSDAPCGDVQLVDGEGRVLLEAAGLELARLRRAGGETEAWLHVLRWHPRPLPPAAAGAPAERGRWLVLADRRGVGEALARRLASAGEAVTVAVPGGAFARLAAGRYELDPEQPEDFRRLLAEPSAGPAGLPWRCFVHLWSLDAPAAEEPEELAAAQTLGCRSALWLLQALGRAGVRGARLLLVTAGAQAVDGAGPVAVAQAPLWGLGRVIAHEHPELGCRMVDLEALGSGAAEVESLPDELWAELRADDREEMVALRGAGRRVARLERLAAAEDAAPPPLEPAGGRPFRLEVGAPGLLDSLAWRRAHRRPPGPGEVEIEVAAAGLNFNDVLKAMGTYPGQDGGPVLLGSECAGRIAAVGAGVAAWRPGDEVVALARGALARFVTASAELVAARPPRLAPEQAAALPVAFLTAQHALFELGRLSAGESVLIHSASGGVGLAAVQLARRAGAVVFATAGTEEKRRFLRDAGIEHVFDSRSPRFAEEVLARTGGRGVDVVLNSLAGEALERGLAVLAPYGRFLEIGKRDIYRDSPLGLAPFRRNLAFFGVDVERLVDERPAVAGAQLRALLARFAAGDLEPPPVETFPRTAAEEAFRHLARARQIGKVAIAGGDEVPVAPAAAAPGVRAEATYLITGGLGGIGLALAGWLAGQGARSLVLAGRGRPGPAAEAALEGLRAAGCRATAVQADVADRRSLAGVLARIDGEMPPLRGLIHAAAVLDDATLLRLDRARLDAVLAPKVLGAWNCHLLTRDRELDHFVLFSSAASLLGSPGQGNYAAANAFLDALAHHRRSLGLPAQSIGWGPWSEVGLAARGGHAERLGDRGMASIDPRRGVDLFGRLLARGPAHVGVLPLDLRQWRQVHPGPAGSPLLERLEAPGAAAGRGRDAAALRAALLAAAAGEPRRALLERHAGEQLARVLRVPAARLDPEAPFQSLGLDSLMALELRNRLEASLGLALPATLVWSYPTLAALAGHLAASLAGGAGGEDGGGPGPAVAQDPDLRELLRELEGLPDEEVRRQLGA